MDSDLIRVLVAAFLGGASQELLHWYSLRSRLHLNKYKQLLKSKVYWILTLITLILTPLGVLAWFWDSLISTPTRDVFILGVGFPLTIKKIAQLVSTQDNPKLGIPAFKPFSSYLS